MNKNQYIIQIAKFLLQHGADINFDRNKMLETVVEFYNVDFFKLLVDNGFDFNFESSHEIVNSFLKRKLDFIFSNKGEILKMLDYLES